MGCPTSWYRLAKHGVELSVRLTPRSSRDAIEGIAEAAGGRPHLKARVRAVPEAGQANRALEKLLAKWLCVPQRDVAVTAGGTSRLKIVAIAGDAADLAARLDSARTGRIARAGDR